MAKIAIDVVLLLPEEIQEQAVRLNQQLDTSEIDFMAADIHPHISLLMGCLDQEDIPTAVSLLKEAAKELASLPLQIGRLVKQGSVSFEIEKTPELQHLHEHLLRLFTPYLSYPATEQMFYRPEEVQEKAVQYVSRFLEEASQEQFWPHITLGYGDYPEKDCDLPFSASRLALCHLGKHCTCREILYEVQLS